MTRVAWTPDRIERLKKLYAAKRTFQEIAEALGTSRSAVSGKIGQLGLYGRKGVKPRGFLGGRRAA